MADCFGLSLLYDYLAVPFLRLKAAEQRRALDQSLAQLAASGAALDARIAVASHTQHVAACAARKVVAGPANAPGIVSRAAKPCCSHEPMLAAPENIILPECAGQAAPSQGGAGEGITKARSAFDTWLDEDCNLNLSPIPVKDSDTDDDFYGPQSFGFATTLALEPTQKLAERESGFEAPAASPLSRDAHDNHVTFERAGEAMRASRMSDALSPPGGDNDTEDAVHFDEDAASVDAQNTLEPNPVSNPARFQDGICTRHGDELSCPPFASPLVPHRSRLSKLKVESTKPKTEVSAAARAAILVAMDAKCR